MSEMILQEPDRPASDRLSKAQKAAVILCLLDKDGAPLFKDLGEASIRSFVRVMAQIGRVDEATVKSIVGEFLSHLDHRGESVECGAKVALDLVEANLGRAAAAQISESVDLIAEGNVWKRVAMINPQVVAGYLAQEHPQAAALILTKLPPEYAGTVLGEIETDQARQIVQYFRSMKGIAARSADVIGNAVGQLLVANRAKASAPAPAERMGAIMNYAPAQVRDGLIEHLDGLDREFARAVKRSMFTFADIEARVERTNVSKIVRAVDSGVLVKALAGDDPVVASVRTFVLSNISNRMAEMISDEIKEAGAIKRKDADKAQAEVIRAIAALKSAGEIELITEEG